VKQEIRLARQEGKSVCPVKGPGVIDLNKLPRWLGHIYDLAIPEQKNALFAKLKRDAEPRRAPTMAPAPPEDFVARPKEFDALKTRLLDPEGDSVAGITAALRGAGGYGKTTLAKALARDPDIQDAYFDGILWAELGEKPERLIATLSDLVTLLSGERPQLETINAAAAKLAETLSDRRILMVVDGVLPATAAREKVDAMQAVEALSLLSGGLPADQAIRERAGLRDLAGRLGEWPLLIKIVNGFLRNRVKDGEPLPVATTGANTRLNKKGLTASDKRDETQRANAVALTIGVSLDLLSAPERERFGELAVFPEDADIPIGVVARLWAPTGGPEDFETDDLLGKLFDLSLLLERDLEQKFFRLHDTVRHFLRDRAGEERLVEQHKQLVAALDGAATADADARTRRYTYLYLPHHLAEAGEREKLDARLFDPGWLKAKLEATGSPQALFSDYQLYGAGEAQSLIGRTLRVVSGICARDSRQLPVQLVDRLARIETAGVPDFVDKARALIPRPAIVPLWPSLTPPGAETARLEGHTSAVTALCLLPDGRLASGSWDKTIRLWDVAAGAETARLEGHENSIQALCLLPDGRLSSGSEDRTIRLWDVTTGTEPTTLEGHYGGIQALCLLQDGRLASGSWDFTIRLWSVATGTETTRLEGHKSRVQALCLLPDGRVALGSGGNSIQLWDVATAAETAGLEGHTDSVQALCLLPDGRLASGSSDSTIRLWDVVSGSETARLEGHTSGVTALCLLPDGRLASGSGDSTIRLWNVATTAETARLEGHTGLVWALCLLPDGRLVSGSADNTIRLWDVATGAETTGLEGHMGWVQALCLRPDGRLASGSRDNTIRLWDVGRRAEIVRLELDAPVLSIVAPSPTSSSQATAWAGCIGWKFWTETPLQCVQRGGNQRRTETRAALGRRRWSQDRRPNSTRPASREAGLLLLPSRR
jgi:WD40 repeat protein